MEKVFDFHYHLLFKHHICPTFPINKKVQMRGLANLLDNVSGEAFDSQASPVQIKESPLYVGVISILSVEHAFANRILHKLGLDFSWILPLDKKLFRNIKEGKTTYYAEFKKQVDQYLSEEKYLKDNYSVIYLQRSKWRDKPIAEIETILLKENKHRYMAFSIEGGHNLSNVPIKHGTIKSFNPQLNLEEIQNRTDIDFISLNLCHLSEIPEQLLGGFAQGVNRQAQIAFKSDDFLPKTTIGVTELGRKVIRQALTHPTKPILIDIKHMSLYTRLHFYQIRNKLIEEKPEVENLPLICSHTGFTFNSISNFILKKKFRSSQAINDGLPVSIVEPENVQNGRTDDRRNEELYVNPWTINLFDEDIIEIMESKGLIGISLDQRILGVAKAFYDGRRGKYYEGEYVSRPEWEKLFRDGQLPGPEGLKDWFDYAPRKERHIMLLCLHIIYAVRLGKAKLNWVEGTSPWDCICIGSDFDGIINPINGIDNVTKLGHLRPLLRKYIPHADKYLLFFEDHKALDYNEDGTVKSKFLDEAIEKFLFKNGVHFIARYLANWKE